MYVHIYRFIISNKLVINSVFVVTQLLLCYTSYFDGGSSDAVNGDSEVLVNTGSDGSDCSLLLL
jgi:hypothetical protein